jgi:hypothetical protein
MYRLYAVYRLYVVYSEYSVYRKFATRAQSQLTAVAALLDGDAIAYRGRRIAPAGRFCAAWLRDLQRRCAQTGVSASRLTRSCARRREVLYGDRVTPV